uniref:Linalool synthase n=1 Tax=Phyla dulcis TaxID=542674 RepID=A0A2H4RGI1_PHYDL|nr:linalool synthase [Phyla dulcis]
MATINFIMAHAAIVRKRPNKSICHFVRKRVTCSSTPLSGAETATGANRPDSTIKIGDEISAGRRSGNYEPPTWDFDYVQSLSNHYTEEKYSRRAKELVAQVKKLLQEELKEPIQQLELIDDLQRMGISYHFKDKIKEILNSIYDDNHHRQDCKNSEIEADLYSTALKFRLLRQHGFTSSEEVFDCFKNDNGDFKASLADDTRGLLQLYEASFLLMEGEETLEKAKEFATKFLQKNLYDEGKQGMLIDDNLLSLVHRALEIPIHHRTQRLNARWSINAYGNRSDKNPVVHELAKLDFNLLQATFQQELKHVSRWWKQTGLAEKLPFARDRLVECYFWTIGWLYEPQYVFARSAATKFVALINVIDDIYDIYGTLEELHLFQDAIQRWDIEAIGQLPQYMQLCFLALDNFINEIGYHVLKEQGFLAIPYLRKSWQDLCTSYFQEAKWYYAGYVPTLEEYIGNARISISSFLALSHTYFLVANPIEKEVLESLYNDPDLSRYSSVIFRLEDDLGTSLDELKRGDVPKAIECYMNESGANRDEAQKHIEFLIWDTWKKLNKEQVANSLFPQFLCRNAVDLCRTAQLMYQHGDGHRISTLLFEPIL